MSVYGWNTDKNDWLFRVRGISFEQAVRCIESEGGLLDVLAHPNSEKYPNQRMFVIEVENHAHLVPFVESEEQIFLKTIIPSRKATKHYLGGSS
jgi:uncharacterized DUF497 family protein